MKLLKCALIILIVFAVIVLLIFGMIITAVNDNSAAEIEKELLSLPLPENTVVVQSLSQAGKLWGNGNGMQYYGAMLIDSQLSLEKLSEHYSKYNCSVSIQYTTEINTDHGEFHFAAATFPEKAYIVEKFGRGVNVFFEQFDLRGH